MTRIDDRYSGLKSRKKNETRTGRREEGGNEIRLWAQRSARLTSVIVASSKQ
jgi:hypothetical protein